MDPTHPDHAPAYLAALEPPPEPPPGPKLNPHLTLLARVRACPDGGEPGCGCAAMRSCRRLGRDVPLSTCLECVKADDDG